MDPMWRDWAVRGHDDDCAYGEIEVTCLSRQRYYTSRMPHTAISHVNRKIAARCALAYAPIRANRERPRRCMAVQHSICYQPYQPYEA